MSHHTQLEDKLGGANNLHAWKYKISLILEENDLDQYTTEEVTEPEGNKNKSTHKKNLIKNKIIIADSIKDHLIPHVSFFKTPKEVFDALTKMFEGNNINQKIVGDIYHHTHLFWSIWPS